MDKEDLKKTWKHKRADLCTFFLINRIISHFLHNSHIRLKHFDLLNNYYLFKKSCIIQLK